ncbi:LytTR family DNA-binding domain-containing protein [Mucilaginibacter polytrichastri]|uniref:HTH LytTR-type domain-containing protein n=1 Tax=Mucilaginibacter polytrichastri TaxID=1302689 RepID=A0A1Q5ZXB3_9SPHI|nr:LytTR family DNA-binding domain-containing protein [Mucilaginibacter polytrichastri]OKS86414.1 hypothetical protein RG47T_1870 [Mucilaginibacter polytrichastri]SFT27550.1 transcriptional regulator, LytTR family [Mucilaginibacter polytrichastri]
MPFDIKHEQLFKEIDYPLRYRPENLVKSTGVLFGILFIFLMLFKPFGVYAPEQKINYFIICFLHALSPALILCIYFSTLNHFRVINSNLKKWTLLQEYLHVALLLLLIGLSSFLMRDLIYSNPDNWSLRYLWEEIRNCYLAGCLFYFYLTFAAFYFRFKKVVAPADYLFPISCVTENIVVSEISIKTQVKQDDFSFMADHLLFAKADGNYVELTTNRHGIITTELKRITLKQFEAQIAVYPYFFRCHRAYLVNMTQIEKVSGNSQGYLLSFNAAENKIPVSRAQLNGFNSLYEQLRAA